MRKYGWLPAYPLHGRRREDGRLEIISGHHRLCVAKKLGITIKYIGDKTFSEQMMHDLEVATNPWTLKDWLMSQHVHRETRIWCSVMNTTRERA